ncbi:ATP-dependent DNA ligase LigD phosphoesterase module /ATP-dependent DNA ligase LigD polymerase module [Devosia sp. YR412]|uniref:DNA ligase D n=1 Tax=Devosia sp. YR412 TaxID=1881030 RepID=UPI0008BE72EB|nr:DNA ligase D [Devosia sp. YR412]SEQ33308.1 ATP-dependent DNA ligase LigD phosphoesterase module /ATP-dependent DNA ligase LigD polymerase module [Devosia sp. YR412]
MATKPATELLREYNSKRDFTKTQEPSGKAGEGAPGYRFLVQKHDATRLHYDFRIELDGVLKSWAVTKGPSDNPADKRLAVRVEDHPLDYGSFEGTIPEAEYGGGTVMLWDEGTWEPIGDPHAALEAGDLKMKINGHRMKGEYVLVHMKGRDTKRKSGPPRENWLLIKHNDDHAKDTGELLTDRFTKSVTTGRDLDGIAKGLKPKKQSKTKADAVWHSDAAKAVDNPLPKKRSGKTADLPKFREPQLATLVTDIPEGSDWVFEMKYDGYRCQAAISGDQVRLYTRTGKDWTEQFAAIVPPLTRITKGSALIDGELCAFDAKGRTDFSTLKDHLSNGGPLTFFAFDLLELDGVDLAKQPLTERKAKLEKLLGKIESSSLVQFSAHVTGNGQKVFDAIAREGHEGIIAKQAEATYSGSRNRSWLKIKASKRQEFVIAGWSPSTKKKSFASLLLGTWENGKLVYRGRVGTGFTVDSAHDLQQQLDARARKTSPFAEVPKLIARGARWVAPELVAEVGYAEVTPDNILRHPSFLGLREDKPAGDVAMEKPVAKTKSAPLGTQAGIAAAEAAGIKLTSPDRVVYPGQGVTKADLVAYYAAVGERMLPYIENRPLSLLRCPQGRAKYCFFQKHDTGGFPDAMKSLLITEKDGSKEDYFYITDLAGLIAGTQMNVMEWHLWGSRIKSVEKPERIIFDIDPDEGLGFADVRAAAQTIREELDAFGLNTYPLISGGKGIHVIAPLRATAEWPDVKAFCKGIAQRLADREPDRFVATMSKAKRKGKLFIDYLRNERGSTAIAPWSPRSREGAPVAVPISWDELDGIKAANQFSLADAAERARQPDPWTDYFDATQSITKTMLKKLAV